MDTASSSNSVYVVGRGIAGLAAAYELSCAKFDVTVIGPSELNGTATLAAVGVCSVKGNVLGSQPLFRAKIAAQRALPHWLRQLEQEAGQAVPHDLGGLFEVFTSSASYAAIKERVFHRSFTGCYSVKTLSEKDFKDRIHSSATFLRPFSGAFHYFSDLWYDPQAALKALEQVLLKRKVRFVDTCVTRLTPHAKRGIELWTLSGPLQADEVVIACGAFANKLFEASSILGPKQEAVEGETLLGTHEARGLERPLAINAGKMNLVAIADGRLLFGSTSRRRASLENCSSSALAAAELFHKASTYASFEPKGLLWGIRGRFKDQAPALGPLFIGENSRRIWLMLGFHKSGLQLAPFFARHLSNLMRPSAAVFDDSSAFSADFSPTRFL